MTQGRAVSALPVAAALLLTLAACADTPLPRQRDPAPGDREAHAAVDRPRTAEPVADRVAPPEPAPPTITAPELELLSPGGDDRLPLALRAEAGATRRLTLATVVTVERAEPDAGELDAEAAAVDVRVPLRMVLHAEARADDDGAVTWSLTTRTVELLRRVDAGLGGNAVRDAFRQLARLRARVRIGPEPEIRVTLPEGAHPLVRQSAARLREALREFSGPFPDKPLGVGGALARAPPRRERRAWCGPVDLRARRPRGR